MRRLNKKIEEPNLPIENCHCEQEAGEGESIVIKTYLKLKNLHDRVSLSAFRRVDVMVEEMSNVYDLTPRDFCKYWDGGKANG